MQGKALPGRGLILLLATLPVTLIAAPGDPSLLPKAEEQFQHQQQQQKAREARLAAEAPDIRIPVATASSSQLQFPDENPCFTIERVTLAGKEALPHWVPLQRLADQAVGHCLGVQGINMIIGTLQDRIIEHGWVTTRVLAPQQDLREGELTLRIVPGRIRDVALTSDSGRYIRLWPTMPAHAGNLLDLRDIEQGLENMQRLPTVQARMELQPGDAPGESAFYPLKIHLLK
ncbi:POTRA domain-containing protein [Cronobacter dublinensis]